MTAPVSFLIAATRSGSGKTLITLGLLAALVKRGYGVRPFKCGPDFIDPSLHSVIVGRPSINLDLAMMGPKGCHDAYARYQAGGNLAVVEGVMGLFDGGQASSAALARELALPVVLVVDVSSAAESVAAVVRGFETFDTNCKLAGVILNKLASPRHLQLIERAIEQSCTTPVLGRVFRNSELTLPSRHLGLHMGHELDLGAERLAALAEVIEQAVDIDRLLHSCAVNEERRSWKRPEMQATVDIERRPVLAIARDEAFCFYYQENIDLLEEAGFAVEFFSPLHDHTLPPGTAVVYLGGGYPELYAEQLSGNQAMRAAIKRFWADDGLVYGECGGFMYMCTGLIDGSDSSWPMCDIFPVTVKMQPRLRRLGYRSPTFCADTVFGITGERVYGHEFHYSYIVARSDDLGYLYTLDDGQQEGCVARNGLGSYIHLHFCRSQPLLERLRRSALQGGVS